MVMAPRKPRIAIIYDFDKTLSTSEMQDSMIRFLGKEPKEFWKEAGEFAEKNRMDRILAYLYCLKREFEHQDKKFDADTMREFGKGIEFYPGVIEWFPLIEKLAKEKGVVIEHYLISSGMREIVEGTPIFKYFREVYACEFLSDEYGKAIWLKNVINFTTKTQFLFRINKGKLDIWDEKGVNEFSFHEDRPVPFQNMIYIGDGSTDIPCMKIVKQNGGESIAVYTTKSKDVAYDLMYDERITHMCKADYREGKDLHKLVSAIVSRMAIDHPLRERNRKEFEEASEHSKRESGETELDNIPENHDS